MLEGAKKVVNFLTMESTEKGRYALAGLSVALAGCLTFWASVAMALMR